MADSISFVTARPDESLFPISELSQCCQTVMRREGAEILQFGPSDGYPSLKRALIEMLRAEGTTLKDENLLITGGCQQALDLICKAFLRPGDAVLLENPTYPGAIAIFSSARVRCLGVPVQTGASLDSPQGVDLVALEATLLSNRVKLMVLTPDFHNPTGTTMPLASRRKLLEIAGRHQVPIVEDHIYARLHGSGPIVPPLKQLDKTNLVIQIDSFSKVAFPGLRVGWGIDGLCVVKKTTDLHTDQLAQAILAEFIKRGHLGKHITKMRKVYAKRLAMMTAALERYMPQGTRWTEPSGGMCVWVELPLGFDASELLIHLRERGVLFAPGRYFFQQNPQPNTLRLSFTSLDEKRITRGVAMFADLLRQEMRKRQRGSHREETARLALV
jgi:2-aminoadipate transaminase